MFVNVSSLVEAVVMWLAVLAPLLLIQDGRVNLESSLSLEQPMQGIHDAYA